MDRVTTREREDALNEREAWIVRQLQELQEEYRRDAMPLAKELRELREHRDGITITIGDKTYLYTGPGMPYKLPGERQRGS